MKKYLPLNLRRRELDALSNAINSRVISDLNDFPDALLYWDRGRSFYMELSYYENSLENIDATLTYPNIPSPLKQDLQHLLEVLQSSLFVGMVKPADISELRNEMEDYKIWRTKLS